MRVLLSLLLTVSSLLLGQGRPPFQDDFPAAEFIERRGRVLDASGQDALAIVQGAAGVDGFKVFRQSNEFYYLTGLESPHAYLVLDGRSRKTTLYLARRNEVLERGTGAIWSAEDAADVQRLTGVDAVAPVELLSHQTFGAMLRPPRPVLYVPFNPAEGEAQSRDELLAHQAGVAGDPWDGRPSREAHFLSLLANRYPALERRDLTPVLDTLRYVKSRREIALIRKASVLAGLGIHLPHQRRALRGLQPDRRRRHQRLDGPLLAPSGHHSAVCSSPASGGGPSSWSTCPPSDPPPAEVPRPAFDRGEETDLPEGRRRTHWRQSVPIAPWLDVLGVARFAVQHVDAFEGTATLTVRLTQRGAAGRFSMPLQIGVYAAGSTTPTITTVTLAESSHEFQMTVDAGPARVVLDPEHFVLMEATFGEAGTRADVR